MAVVLRPPFWVPKPPDDQPWQLKMEWMNSGVLQQLTKPKIYGAPGQVPTKRWAPYLTHDDPPPWQMPTEWMDAEAAQQLAHATPFTPKRWRLNYNVGESQWQMPSEWMNSAVLQQLARVTFPLFTPFLWRQNYTQNDYSVWVGSPVGPLDTLYRVVANKPFVPQFPDLLDDPPTWQQPKGFNQVLNTTFSRPFTARQPQYYDDASLWTGSPIGISPYRLASFTPATSRPPQFYSEDAYWIGTPTARNPNLVPALPFTIRQPQWYAENAFWSGQPIARNAPLYLAEPFSIRQSVTYFEDSLWTWQARRSPIISALTAAGKPPPFRPNFTYDDAGSWQPKVPTNLILLTTKFTKPFNLSSLWFNAAMFYNVDAPGWVGNPIAAFRSGVPTPPPPRTQIYEWIIRARRRGRR